MILFWRCLSSVQILLQNDHFPIFSLFWQPFFVTIAMVKGEFDTLAIVLIFFILIGGGGGGGERGRGAE